MARSRKSGIDERKCLEAAREFLPALLLVRAAGTVSARNGKARRKPVSLLDLEQHGVEQNAVDRLLGAGVLEVASRGDSHVVLSDPGAAAIDALLDGLERSGFTLQFHNPRPIHVPHWDTARRMLYFRGVLVKHIRRAAPNQEAILGAFESDGWPAHIADPLPPKDALVPSERLREAIHRLNRHLPPPLHFHADGAARGVLWRAAADRNNSQATLPRLRDGRRGEKTFTSACA